MKYSCLLYSKWAWGAIGFLGFWGEIDFSFFPKHQTNSFMYISGFTKYHDYPKAMKRRNV
ncbi:hypothetical protein D922_02456 [Enterococcus faecalis 06-MB-DW-09]|nr:hypothetical protein D922_02456 [Enterococcus faecalis 06-MB-DW-09]